MRTLPRGGDGIGGCLCVTHDRVVVGLSSKLSGVERAMSRLWADQDAKAHAAPRAQELVKFFGERAGPWQRLGLAMRRRAVEADLAMLLASQRAVAENAFTEAGERIR